MGILKLLKLQILHNKFNLVEFYDAMRWNFNLIDALFIGMITSFLSAICIWFGVAMLAIVTGSSIIYYKHDIYNAKSLWVNIIICLIAVLLPIIF